MKNQCAKTMLLCSSVFFILATNTALAQTEETDTDLAQTEETDAYDFEPLVVTGTRQAYRGEFTAQETPQSELTIDALTLWNAGAVDLNQALDLSSSVARQNNFGGLWNSFALRGFVGDENLPSNYLVNGFNAGRGFGGPRDLSGIESVEVLKGPRAALFGRGEPGGTINLVTKRPTFEKEGRLKLSAGSYDTYRTDLDWTSPLSDIIAVRIVGFYEDAESFRDTIETTKHGLSPSIAFHFNDQSQLVYELEYSEQEIPFDRGVVSVNGKLGVIPESRFLGEPGDGPIDTEVLGHQLEFQHDFNDEWSVLLGFNFRDTSLEGFATENGFFGSRQFLQRDGENLTRFRRYRDYDATYRVFRAEISGRFATGEIQHRLIVGMDADEFENDQVFLRARGLAIDDSQPIEDELARLGVTNQVINIFNPVYGAYPLPAPDPNTDRLETQESVGLYLQDQISITDAFDLRLGARVDNYEQELVNRRSNSVSDFSETRVSPQIGGVYKATDSISLYAVYGENFRPLSGATDDNDLEPNQSESMEVGVNFTLDGGALVGNFALFDIEQSNISTVDDAFNATAIGEAESQGIELDIYGNVTDNLSIWLSYAYVDAKTKNDFNDPNFGTVVSAGSDLLNIPEYQLSLQVVYQTQLAGKALSLIGGLTYVDNRNGFFSNQDFRLPSYTTVKVAANYQVTDYLELRVEVNNLFDEEYYTNSFADVWVQPGAPANANFSATLRF